MPPKVRTVFKKIVFEEGKKKSFFVLVIRIMESTWRFSEGKLGKLWE